ncbi:MAG TPA: hypothetical protein VH540_08455 [Ktedonobacterales bacterium]
MSRFIIRLPGALSSLRLRRVQVVSAVIALFILLFSLTLGFVTQRAAAGSTLFADDFEADALATFPPNWTLVSGPWSVQQDGTHVLEQTSTDTTTEKRVLAGLTTWTDYVYQVDVKPGANSPALGLQIIARESDASNYYSFGLFSNTWYLKKRVGGNQTTIAQGNFAYTSQFYTMQFSLQGSALSGKIGATTVFNTTDSSLSAGMIGVSTKAMTELDNVLVTVNGVVPTPTPTDTATSTPTLVPTATNTPGATATNTPGATATNTPTPTATNTPAPTATNTPTPTATNTPTPPPTATPTPPGNNTLFADDFEADTPGAFPPNWTLVGGTWVVQVDGTQVLKQNDPSTSSEKRVLAGSTSWTDYVFQVDVEPGANSPALGLQIIARESDASNYYSFGLFSNTWYLKKKVGGTQTTIAQGNFAYTSQFYTMVFSLQGTSLIGSINGTTLFNTTDGSLTHGQIALSTKAQSEFDNVLVTLNGAGSTPTPTPTATNTPTPTATNTPTGNTPTATSTPGGGGGSSSAGNATLTLTPSGSNFILQSVDANGNGWQVFFNQALGGAITRTQEINNGVLSDVQYQAILHSLVQSYVQTSGNFHANQDQAGQIIILRNTPELVGIETISTNTNIHITWTYFYYFWPNGQIYIQLSIQNTGTNPVSFTTPNSVQINLDGMIIQHYGDQSPQAWYGVNGTIKSPIPATVSSNEANFGVMTPTAGGAPFTGLFLDKFTSWAAAGANNGGIVYLGNTTRSKVQWQGVLSSLAPGQVLPFSLLLDFRRGLTQNQSLSFDSDYRAPSLTVNTGTLATTDSEPGNLALNNGFNMDLGAYVISAAGNHVNAQLNFPAGVSTRWTPRYKIVGWFKGAPTVTWGGQTLTAGVDYNYVVDGTTNTLYLQLNFDVVTANPGAGQMLNAALDIS